MGLPSISGSDILKLLEKLPEWIGIKRQLARISDLEARVAALEAAGQSPAADKCPACPTGSYRFGIRRQLTRITL